MLTEDTKAVVILDDPDRSSENFIEISRDESTPTIVAYGRTKKDDKQKVEYMYINLGSLLGALPWETIQKHQVSDYNMPDDVSDEIRSELFSSTEAGKS